MSAESNCSAATIETSCDILIIGAGPAGLNAGLQVAGKGCSVILVDKCIPWNVPIACAEGVGRLGFEEAVEVKPEWIRLIISKVCFHASDTATVTYADSNKGYIIDRVRMQKDLAGELSGRGVVCRFDLPVASVSELKNGTRFVTFVNGTGVSARVVVDASGPVAGFGKKEKINARPADLEPAYFAIVEGVSLEPDTVHIYLDSRTAPGGYGWAFPRSANSANIGIVIGRKFRGSVNIRRLLDTFLAVHFPDCFSENRFAGAIPCCSGRSTIALPGLIKAGDAACTVNPISRAGISESLLSGKIAGNYALRMLGAANDRQLKHLCKLYEADWYKRRGSSHCKLAKAKNALIMVPDGDYIAAGRALSKIPQNEVTMSRIFATALGRFPRLVWALRYLM